jgi:hypothetical protein
MHLSKLTWTGLACIAAAVTTFGVWSLWSQTRIVKPVYLPVALTPGPVHIPEFRINLSGPYEIRVEVKKRIPFDTLNCLLGMPALTSSQKCEQQSVVQASWVVTGDGIVIAKGRSDADKGGGWANDTIERQIGSFEGKRNRRYSLDVDFTADGSVLRATDPHLVVEITSDFYEGSMWISFLLLLGCSGVAIIGSLFLAASGVRLVYQGRRQRQASAS